MAKIRVNDNIKSIFEKYPSLKVQDIKYCIPIYYPIGMIEVEMDEVSFEDFDQIQLQVLKMISAGVSRSDLIAKLMGLSLNYVQRILVVLEGYGQIKEGQLTVLGMQSLKEQKKVEYKKSYQKFQINALNGNFIKINDRICLNKLESSTETNGKIIHLNFLEGALRQDLIQQINDETYKELILTRDDVSINVQKIEDIRLIEMKYVLSYLFVTNDEDMFICTSRFDTLNKQNHFTWKPFSVSNSKLIDRYSFEKDVPLIEKNEMKFIKQAYAYSRERIETTLQSPDYTQEAQKFIEGIYGNPVSRIICNNKIYVSFDAKKLKSFNNTIYHLLLECAKQNYSTFWTEKFYGIPVYISLSIDEKDKNILNLLKQKVDEMIQGKVRKVLMDSWEENNYKNVFEFLKEQLEKI